MERVKMQRRDIEFWPELGLDEKSLPELREWFIHYRQNARPIANHPSSYVYPMVTYLNVKADPNFDWDRNLVPHMIAPHLGWIDLYSLMRTCRSLYAWLQPVLLKRSRDIFGPFGTPMAFSLCRNIDVWFATEKKDDVEYYLEELFSVPPELRLCEEYNFWKMYDTINNPTATMKMVRELLDYAGACLERVFLHFKRHIQFRCSRTRFIENHITELLFTVDVDYGLVRTFYLNDTLEWKLFRSIFRWLPGSRHGIEDAIGLQFRYDFLSEQPRHLKRLKKSITKHQIEWRRRVMCYNVLIQSLICRYPNQLDWICDWMPLIQEVLRVYPLDDPASIKRLTEWILVGEDFWEMTERCRSDTGIRFGYAIVMKDGVFSLMPVPVIGGDVNVSVGNVKFISIENGKGLQTGSP